MKYFLLALVLGMTSAVAMADTFDNSNLNNNDEHKKKEIEFNCHFRAHKKKGFECRVFGEVCVKKEHHDGPPTANDNNEERCDRDRGFLDIRCDDGFVDRDRAFARFRGDDLIVNTERDDVGAPERLRIQDVRDDEHDRGIRHEAELNLGRDRDRDDRLFGTCRVEKDRDEHEMALE